MECPICGDPNTDELVNEVDIGVGTMTQLIGWHCDKCGQIAACYECGQPLKRGYHNDDLCTKNLFSTEGK